MLNTAKQFKSSADNPPLLYGNKFRVDQQKKVLGILKKNPGITSSAVFQKMQSNNDPLYITERHLNRVRSLWALSRKRGRPKTSELQEINSAEIENSKKKREIIAFEPNLRDVGLHLFHEYLESHNYFGNVLNVLKNAIESYTENNPDDGWFPLQTHKDDTLISRFQALFFAPLMDIGKLTEFDSKQHCLKEVIGKAYQSPTLTEFLCGLERIDAGNHLLELLIPQEPGTFCYIDGHMIAFWSKESMHKGKITMLGRIMSGSNALVAHDDKGRAIYIEYHPPDIHMSNIILDYCKHIKDSIGIDLFVIDREVNSLEIALDFDHNGLGLMSMLNSNQYKSLSDWGYRYIGKQADGSKIYAGQWRDEKKRREDPRHFVILDTGKKLLPYWGNDKLYKSTPAIKWPELYAERTELQENSFKRMKNHGALEINYGIKKIWGPDRHQERKNKDLYNNLTIIQENKQKKIKAIDLQKSKVKESETKNHPKMLPARKKKLEKLEKEHDETRVKEQKIKDKIEDNGPPKERADRDFRKQLIMTIRTLCLENILMKFFNKLLQNIDLIIGLDSFIDMFFNRTGSYYETDLKVTYSFDCEGLSKACLTKMKTIIKGYNDMKLKRNGKIIEVKIRGVPI